MKKLLLCLAAIGFSTAASSADIYTNTDEDGWFGNATLSGMMIVGESDVSVEYIRELDGLGISSVTESSREVYINKDGITRKWECDDKEVITSVYYVNGPTAGDDDSIEEIKCTKLNGSKTNARGRVMELFYNEKDDKKTKLLTRSDWVECETDSYITGVYYKSEGDDYITNIICTTVLYD